MVFWIQTLPVFALVLGAMIFVHELGHFLVAKWLGIRVEIFSLGFGTRLWGFKRGDTDYRLSLVPLGGYVKMAGDNLAEDREGAPDEFLSHSKWHRFLVAIAGPVMNIITALAIPLVASMIHYEIPAYLIEPAVVASTPADSPAGVAGIQTGDHIVKFNGEPVATWRDLSDHVMLNPGQTVKLTVDRNGQPADIPVTLGVSGSGAEKIGSLGAFPNLPGATVVVVKTVVGSRAESAGMQAGDSILAVNGQEIGADVDRLVSIINKNANQELSLSVKRANGEQVELKATPEPDADGLGRLGFQPATGNIPMIVTRLGPTDAVVYSFETNMRFIRLTGTAFSQIFQGNRKVGESLSGPIGIAHIVGQATQQGVGQVFELMGLLSLNLGVFNLLPIPVLDGGLIFMLALEALLGFFGLTLSVGAKEKMLNVGLVLIVLLMGFVIFNDITKYIIPSKSAESPPANTQKAPPPPPEQAPQTPVVPVK